jgi:hypothetical protein
MAKKSKKKSAKKAAKKTSKKVAKRTARKAGGGRRAARGGGGGRGPNPAPVSTGSGASPMEIGRDLVARFNAGQLGGEIEDRWWAPNITSVEGVGIAMAWSGREKVEEKNRAWMETHIIHGASAEGPYVGATGFAVKFRMDIEDKTTGKREVMEEVGVYTVEKGKIVREEFMYRVGE